MTDIETFYEVTLISMRHAFEYDELELDPGSEILSDMVLDEQRQHVYVLSETKVFKLKLQTCEQHTNCSLCLETRDPYCGWCSLEKRYVGAVKHKSIVNIRRFSRLCLFHTTSCVRLSADTQTIAKLV
ncbi:Plexin-B [Amphibalanus amphitrite]|uniref:Plexin-B n=1 Tax=Amphibalanus amphitrite TaxID=1232801 RepID=A0A6A4WXS0_AMPAM|nr:Plexin-B [Amphibalanus amphitrite]